MAVDSARADDQSFCYLPIGMALGNQPQHFLLSPGKTEVEMILGKCYSLAFLTLGSLSRSLLAAWALFQLPDAFLQGVHQVNGPLHFVLEKQCSRLVA